LFVLN
jgi:hypothetical protein